MNKYVAYYRCSTTKQGLSQLGIEAQKRAVAETTKNCNDCIIAEFEEHESGGKNDRPKLKAALKICGDTGATLVIAKLDRLSRNAAFILTLIEKSKTAKKPFKILFCDNPNIDETMLGMLAIFAQHERKIMSERQKATYESKRLRGAKIGNTESLTLEVRQKGIEAKKQYRAQNEDLMNAKEQIKNCILLAKATLTANDIVLKLNKLNIKTIRGFDYELKNVRPIIKEVLTEMGLKSLPSATPTPSVLKVKNDTSTAKNVSMKMRSNGKTLQEISDFLNDNGFMTAKGKTFNPIQVKRLIEK